MSTEFLYFKNCCSIHQGLNGTLLQSHIFAMSSFYFICLFIVQVLQVYTDINTI